MALQRLAGQGLAFWRFGFGGRARSERECLDGSGPVLDGGRAASCQGRFDEGAGELLEVMAGGIGDVAQGPLPGEYG